MTEIIKAYLEKIDKVVECGAYQADWESLSKYPLAQWYKEAKFGAFIHWGAYCIPEYFTEWYIRMMHYKGNPIYWHHNKKYGKDYPYSKFIDAFTAPKFDAENWISLLKGAGMKYIMPVAEHHDGYKLYDSELTRWTTVKQAMKRDVIKELKEACDKEGLKFAASSHRAEHYWFVNGARTLRYKTEATDPAFADLYGPMYQPRKKNNLFNMLKQENGISADKEWLEDWLVSSAEIVDKYRPDNMYFDWWVMEPSFRPYLKKFIAYYYNRSIEWGKGVTVQCKYDAVMPGAGIYDCERGQLDNVSPNIWQSETSTAYNAWCYTPQNRYKAPEEIAAVLADVISKNGNFVLNIGPKADGTICDKEVHILKELGKWTEKNKEAIWGTTAFKVFGEGKKKKGGSFQEKKGFTTKDFRYTYRTGHVYSFACKPTKDGVYCMRLLNNHRDSFGFVLKGVKLLGYTSELEVTHDKKGLCIKVKNPPEGKMPLVFDIEID